MWEKIEIGMFLYKKNYLRSKAMYYVIDDVKIFGGNEKKKRGKRREIPTYEEITLSKQSNTTHKAVAATTKQ